MIVYKVVKPYDGHYCSAVATITGLQLLYRVGHVTKPCFGKLFAFRCLDDAEDFALRPDIEGIVFTAFTKGTVREPVGIMSWGSGLTGIIAFWRGEKSYECETPEGTVLCDDIKLIRRV